MDGGVLFRRLFFLLIPSAVILFFVFMCVFLYANYCMYDRDVRANEEAIGKLNDMTGFCSGELVVDVGYIECRSQGLNYIVDCREGVCRDRVASVTTTAPSYVDVREKMLEDARRYVNEDGG